MLRKLAIAIAASGAMISTTNVLALGMGDIKLESALNQPLDARIKLLKASELENWEMKPNLASTEQFEKSGVEHVFFLSNLKFAIERSGEDVYVHVTSNQAVVEPYLNFLVQVDWPSGRLLREYTLLLDPPVFNEDTPVPVNPAAGQSGSDIAPDSMALPGTAPAMTNGSANAPFEKITAQEAPSRKSDPSTYNVRKNDTLWEVAIRTRGNRSISPQQAMLAIQDLNPTAFINGNINRLKTNQVLRVPDEQQMLSRSFNEAVAEVAVQNQAIAQRKAQLDATRKDTAMQRDDELTGTQLKLLAGGEATTDNERSASGQVEAKTEGDQSSLEQDLSITLENLDKTTRENQELRSRLDSLEDQINTLQRLINLKDEQMIALQSGMAAKPADVALDDAAAVEPAQPDAEKVIAESPQVADKEATDKQAAAPKPKPDLTAPVEQAFDPVAFVMNNPPIIGAGLGALLLGLLGVSYARKRKQNKQDDDDAELGGDKDPLDDGFNDDLGGFGEDSSSGFDANTGDVDLSGDIDQAASVEDMIDEADRYLSYNRPDPARAVLEKAIESQPARMDLRLKMVEVLSTMGAQAALAGHIDFINANGSAKDKSAAAEFQVSEEVNEDFANDFGLDDDFSMSDLSDNKAEPDALDLSFNEESSDLDFDLDGLELNDNAESASDLDFNSDFDSNNGSSGSDASTDLDMSLDASGDNNSMDFDLSDFESSTSDKDVVLDEIEEPAIADLDSSLDSLSLDSGSDFEFTAPESTSNDLSFELNDNASDDSGLDFGLPASDSDIPELSTEDDLADLSLDNSLDDLAVSQESALGIDTGDDLDLESLDSAGDFEFSSLELGSKDDNNDNLPEFEEGLSFDEDDAELPELTDDALSDLDSELDALAGDDIDLPTLESGSNDLDELPELQEDVDLSAAPEALEPVEDIAAEYKETLPSLDDAVAGDDFPDLGDPEDIDLENLDNDLDFLSGTDESETKLDLARAYIDMEDQDGAREILQEVLDEGTDKQKQDANKLMDSLV